MTRRGMQALVKDGGKLALRTVPSPQLDCDEDVVVKVELAGLCRTDVYVAEGRIKSVDPLVLGHEFAGRVEDAGDACGDLSVGTKVTVNPLFPCRKCDLCLRGRVMSCQCAQFLGVDKNGCFAGYVLVPRTAIHCLPDGISFIQAAYAEPVAASLAVLKAGIDAGEKGLVLGKNRFSTLLERIFAVKGFANVTICDIDEIRHLECGTYDFVVETIPGPATLGRMIEAVRPGGKIILKSRHYEPVMLGMVEAIKKEPVIHVVNYGSFTESLSLLADGSVMVDDLSDGIYELERFGEVLTRAGNTEALKPFFAPWGN